MRRRSLVLILFLISASGLKHSVQQCAQNEHAFEVYLNTLDSIPLPFLHNPRASLPDISKNYDRKGFEQYKHAWTSKPVGIVFMDDSLVVLMDCSIGDYGPVPFLTTFDRLGNKKDSLGPYKKSGEDEAYSAIEYMSIRTDRIILVKDTVIRYNQNPDGSGIVERLKTISSNETKYKIRTDGHILTVN